MRYPNFSSVPRICPLLYIVLFVISDCNTRSKKTEDKRVTEMNEWNLTVSRDSDNLSFLLSSSSSLNLMWDNEVG